MGRFTYEAHVKVDFDDRALAHLQLVMTSKLRRGEPFPFSWRDDPSIGDGRTTVWVHSGAALVFKFHGSRPPTINARWVEALAYVANGNSGLHLVPEPEILPSAEQAPPG